MSDPLIRACDHYVVIEPGKKERFLNEHETLVWLENCLKSLEKLPKDLEKFASRQEAAQHLLDTACDLDIKPGISLQWFAVRLEHPVT